MIKILQLTASIIYLYNHKLSSVLQELVIWLGLELGQTGALYLSLPGLVSWPHTVDWEEFLFPYVVQNMDTWSTFLLLLTIFLLHLLNSAKKTRKKDY